MGQSTVMRLFNIGLALFMLVMVSFAIVVIVSVSQPTLYVQSEARPEFGTHPPDCGHLYNTGRAAEWRECMGVGPK